MATRTESLPPLEALEDAIYRLLAARTSEGDSCHRDIDAALRSAVRAVLPGRQQKGNLTPVMDAARKAFIRTLRRRAK
jgi:hypothetical protein